MKYENLGSTLNEIYADFMEIYEDDIENESTVFVEIPYKLRTKVNIELKNLQRINKISDFIYIFHDDGRKFQIFCKGKVFKMYCLGNTLEKKFEIE